MPEIVRIISVEEMEDIGWVEAECPTCHKRRHLYYNGGELDVWRCCGNTLILEATGYRLDLVRAQTEGKQETPQG